MGWLGRTYRTTRSGLGIAPPAQRALDRLWFRAVRRRDSLLQSMVDRVPKGAVVLDVGAGLGVYALTLAQSNPTCSIYGFEPNAPTFESLQASIELHDLGSRVRVARLAVGDTVGETVFYSSTEAGRSGVLEYNAKRGDGKVAGTTTVPCTTVDELVRTGACPPPQAIKIDVEGFEYEVIEGARQTLIDHQPLIYFDGHAREDPERRYPAILQVLLKLGYEVENRKPVFLAWPRGESVS